MRIATLTKALPLALAALFLMGIAAPAHADITAVLDNSTLTGAPGDTLQFFVTLTNTSSTDTVWLNGISSTASSPFLLSIDTSPFDLNAPYFLDPGQSSGDFEFFDVTIDPSAPDGPYVGSFVSIQGGADGGAGTAFNDLVDVSFDVDVQSPAVTTPEPSALLFLALGLASLLFARFRDEDSSTANL